MLQISGQKFNSTSLRNTSFGSRHADYGSRDNEMSTAELKAAKIEEMAQKIAESQKTPSTARSFAIVAALMVASALTAAAAAGRFYNLLNQIGALKKVTPKVSENIEKYAKKFNTEEVAKGFKGTVKRGVGKALAYLETQSKYGIEEKLAGFNRKKSRKVGLIKKELIKNMPELGKDKKALNDALGKAIETNPKYKEFFDSLNKQAHDAKGSNITKKVTKATAATVMGYGALKEASRDADNNGVPDCVEYRKANKEATQKMTAAILDCALDTI